jgi:transposase InsO family protein
MSLRRLIVSMDPATVNVTAFCRAHGVSTWFFWDLRRRYARDGDAVLEAAPPIARRIVNKTPLAVEDAIVSMRKDLANAGLDAGPETIAFHLRDLAGLPSPSTIWRILKARGFIVAEPAKAPRSAHRSFTAERANECWQLDDTTWALADGTEVKILNIIDDHSRLAVASVALATCTGTSTLRAFAAAAGIVGWPARFLSDNAPAFRHTLAAAMAQLGIAAGHSRPYHPQTNGKVERFHLTLKRWLARQPPAEDLAQLQHQLNLFRLIYNHHRPHRSIAKRYPADVWAAAPKTGPAHQPLGTPTHIHETTIHDGRCHIAKRYDITIGTDRNGQPALAIITGTHCHVFINGQLVRALTLDPTRRRQPRYNRPGRPTTQP